MRRARITDLDGLRAIERDGIEAWMPIDRVHEALVEVEMLHADRPALAALPADGAALRRWTHAQLLTEIRRSANLFCALAGDAEPCVALLLLPEARFALSGAEAVGRACPINPALSDDHIAAMRSKPNCAR